MPTVMELTETVQGGVIKAVEASQRWTLGALRTTTSAFDGAMPKMPTLPFADKLPTPQETIDASYSFAERLMSAQKSFVSELTMIGMPEK